MAATESAQEAARAADDLYRRHGAEVYRYALAVLGNHADAEDVTQTTFLNAYRSLEQGVRPRKPSNWLHVIAGNAIKQKFRQESTRPREVALDDQVEDASPDDTEPTVGELLTALSRIPPNQRQAIVLREFEGRSYKEIAEILGVTTSALETLLFRARRSLADELEHQITCADAQFAISQATDGRITRKEKRRLRRHVGECPDCARFALLQRRQRRALRGLALIPVPVSFSFESSAKAATLPVLGTASAAAGTAGSGVLAGGVAVKVAAVVAAASVAGGVGVVGAAEVERERGTTPVRAERSGERDGQIARVPPADTSRRAAIVTKASSGKPGSRIGQINRPTRGKASNPSSARRARPDAAVGARRGQGVARRNEPGRSDAQPRPRGASSGHSKPKAAAEPSGLSRRGGPAGVQRSAPIARDRGREVPARRPSRGRSSQSRDPG